MLAVALAGPVSGPAVADSPENAAEPTTPVGSGTEQSWLGLNADGLQDTGDFAETSGAASRARLRTPLVADSCLQMQTAANGSRSFTETMLVYIPIREGSYAMSSRYGYRFHPITGVYKLHEGDDFQAPQGTPIHSIADGVVTFAGYEAGAGYKTVIQHTDTDGSTVESWYYHQAQGSQLVAEGDYVEAGQQIGSVGTTGNSTGPHLHLEIHPEGGASVSPTAWLDAHEAIYLGEGCS